MNQNLLRLGQLFVLKISPHTGYSLPNIMGVDAVIINSTNSDFVRNTVLDIRRHHQSEVYLKPIFLQNHTPRKNSILNGLIDGVISGDNDLVSIEEKTKDIFIKSLDLFPTAPKGVYGSVIKKALDLIYTRQLRRIQPILDPYSIIGYSFPPISISFEQHEETEVLSVLDWAEKEGYIWPDFEDKIYLCNQCSGGLLSFREVCPHCKSSNTYGEDLIHHFPCAYIGPISDFQKVTQTDLSCPKCNKTLHHIGVDYDKPSVLNHCNNCDSSFQDIYVKAKCLNCENDTDVQYLHAKDINAYKLTKKGRLAITHGVTDAIDFSKDNLPDLLNEATFESLLHFDCKRSEISGELTHICGLYLENLNDFSSKFGGFKKQSILREISQEVKGEMTELDYMTLSPNGIFMWTQRMIEEVDENNPHEQQKIAQRIRKLVQENFDQFEINIKFTQIDLKENNDAYSLIQEVKRILTNQ
jgi:hypothetical protein